MDLPVLARGLTARDIPYVRNSWLKNYRHRGYHVRGVPSPTYFDRHGKLVTNLAARAAVVILCDPEAPDVIYGWICAEFLDSDLVIHYCYVKAAFKASQVVEPALHEDGCDLRERKCSCGASERETPTWRGFHVGQTLLELVMKDETLPLRRIVYTHETKSWREFLGAMRKRGVIPRTIDTVYDPYIMYSSLPHGWAG